MIRLSFDPGSLILEADKERWSKWLARSKRATDKVVGEFEDWYGGGRKGKFTASFQEDIWKELKEWFFESVTHKKCAYCECRIQGAHPDAEHYRPKGAVTHGRSKTEAKCSIDASGSRAPIEIAHPGYFWLAYTWENLIPACKFCNSGDGKNARFDVKGEHAVLLAEARLSEPERAASRESEKWKGYFYPSPAALDRIENPLLLNTPIRTWPSILSGLRKVRSRFAGSAFLVRCFVVSTFAAGGK